MPSVAVVDNTSLSRTAEGQRRSSRGMDAAAGCFKRWAVTGRPEIELAVPGANWERYRERWPMLRTIKAVIQPDGTVQLLEPIQLGFSRRALLTILEDGDDDARTDTLLLSEAALAKGRSRPEEDAAWAFLQRAQ
jgi:hypothetical protein